jgi:hypothetical protein
VSPYPIMALWLPLDAETTDSALLLSIQNTTGEAIETQAAALVAGPNGRAASVDLGAHVVAGKSSVEVPVYIDDLPVQSTGAATLLEVHVDYEVDRDLDGTMRRLSRQALAPARYVTFEPGWSQAHVRTGLRQSEEETRRNRTPDSSRPSTVVRVRGNGPDFVLDVAAVEAAPGESTLVLTPPHHARLEDLPEELQRVLRDAEGGAR